MPQDPDKLALEDYRDYAMSLSQVAKEMGISKRQVRNIERKALRKLLLWQFCIGYWRDLE